MPRTKKITKPENVKSQEQEVQITVTLVPTEHIDDNPYNMRMSYPQDEVKKMGVSLQTFGLRQVPTGRRTKEGRVQLAFGHVRLRGFRDNQENAPGDVAQRSQWKVMPLVLKRSD